MIDKRRVHRAPQPAADLTLEQIALLPLCGIPAHRAVASLPVNIGSYGSRVLVLQSHRGPGALACQELKTRGVLVIGQIPKENEVINRALALSHGASSVIAEEPLAAISKCHDEEFDAVLDSVGGGRIWDACRRVLRNSGQVSSHFPQRYLCMS